MIEAFSSIEAKNIMPNFCVFASEEFSRLEPNIEERISVIWDAEKEKRKDAIFDGKILSLRELNSNYLLGEFIPYRSFLAQSIDPYLAKKINVFPVGVSGIMVGDRHVLVGKRSSLVTSYPGHYEFVPSGSISYESSEAGFINYRMQILKELYEETGILPTYVTSLQPFALLIDRDRSLVDICLFFYFGENFPTRTNNEYLSLFWLPFDEVEEFLMKNSDKFVPTSFSIFSLIRERKWI